ncbi:MAG: hypothetical protein KIS65_05360 [Nitrosomonas sp.]|nr:hypothetical protein [Nitrosomonas sp.]
MSDNNGRFLSRLIWITIAAMLLVLLLRASPDYFAWDYFSMVANANREAEPRTVVARGNLAEDEQSTITLFENSRDAVVFITTRQHVRDAWTRNIFSVPSGTGSGLSGMTRVISSPIFTSSKVPVKRSCALPTEKEARLQGGIGGCKPRA